MYDAATNKLEKQYLQGHGNGSLSSNHLHNVVQLTIAFTHCRRGAEIY
jgi:hypothetical protein